MKKFLLYTLLATILSSSFIYAETPKQSKTAKTNDVNKTMTDEEFMSRFMILDEQEKDAKAKTIKTEKELEASKKLGKTLDEINKLLDNNKK